MTNKSKSTLLLIGGGYLVYMGSRLISEVMKSHPVNETLFMAFGAFFIIFGVVLAGGNLKKLYDIIKGDKESDVIVEDIDLSEEIGETFVQKKEHENHSVQMVKLKSGQSENEEIEEAETDDIEEAEDDTEEIEDDEEEFLDEDDAYMDEEDEAFEAEEDEDLFETKLERI